MLLKLYTYIHVKIWVKMHRWNTWYYKKYGTYAFTNSWLFDTITKIYCLFPFPSEFKKEE